MLHLFRSHKAIRSKPIRSFLPDCEALEPRWQPATASYNAVKQLLTVQAAATETITISQAAGQPDGHLQVSDGGGVIFNNAVPSRFVKDVVVKVGGGAGASVIDVAVQTQIAGSLTIKSKAADGTSLNLDSVIIGKHLNFTSTAAASVDLVASSTFLLVGGNINVKLGGGDGFVDLENAVIGGSVSMKCTDLDLRSTVIGGNLTCRFTDSGTAAFNDGPSTVDGNVTFAGSAGSDSIFINQDTTIGGDLTCTMGQNVNTFALNAGTDLKVSGALTYSGGAALDSFRIGNLTVAKSLTVNLGHGDNEFSMTAGNSAEVKGNLTITAGAGQDEVNFQQVLVHKNLKVNLGDGGDSLDPQILDTDASMFIAGSLALRGGNGQDEFDLSSFFVLGSTSVTTLGGNDVVMVADVGAYFGAASISTGAGNDIISVDSATGDQVSFAAKLTILGGGGDDTLNLGLNAGASLLFGGKATFNGGSGVNTRTEQGVIDFNGITPVFINWPL